MLWRRDALTRWFEKQRADAYRLFSSGRFAVATLHEDADRRTAMAHKRNMTDLDTVYRFKLLAEAYQAGDFEQGNAHVRKLAEAFGRSIPEQTQVFDILAVWFMNAEATIQEARIRWAASEVHFIPSAPILGRLKI